MSKVVLILIAIMGVAYLLVLKSQYDWGTFKNEYDCKVVETKKLHSTENNYKEEVIWLCNDGKKYYR